MMAERPTLQQRAQIARDDDSVIGMVLAEVRDMGPTTVLEVAANCGISEATARRKLAALEGLGLVESENYQRRARVYMTPEV